MKIVLLGYMGSGKSTIGKLIAETLGYTFKDLDAYIEKKEEMRIPDIFSEKGEIYFRKKETAYLKAILKENNNIVIATGGGTPCYGDNIETLLDSEDVLTVYLKASIAILTDRLFEELKQRPLIAHLETKPLLNDFIRKHLFERAFYYNKAKIVQDTDFDTPKKITEKLVAKLL